MPQIPDYDRRARMTDQAPGAMAPLGFANQGPEAAMEKAGYVVSEIGNQLDKKLIDVAKVRQLTELKVDSTQKLFDLHDKLTTSPEFVANPTAIPGAFRDQVQKMRKDYISQISDPTVQARFDEHFANKALTLGVEIRNASRKSQIQAAQGSYKESLWKLQSFVSMARTPQDVQDIVNQGDELIDLNVSIGVIPQDDAPKIKRDNRSAVGSVLVRQDMRTDPNLSATENVLKVTNTRDRLLNGDYDQFLTPENREKLIDHAQKQSEILINHTDAEVRRLESKQERDLKKLQDQTEMDAFASLKQGRLTIPILEELRQNRQIDSGAYKALHRSISNQESIDFPHIETEMWERLYDDETNQKDFRREILKRAGTTLKNSTVNEMISRSHAMERENDVSKDPIYKGAKAYIDSQLKTTGPLAALDTSAEARRSRAKREFDDRVRNHEDPWTVADDILPRYRDPATVRDFPKPMFLPTPEITFQTLDVAEQETARRLHADRITPGAYQREIDNINKLREILVEEQRGKSKSTSGKTTEQAKKDRGMK